MPALPARAEAQGLGHWFKQAAEDAVGVATDPVKTVINDVKKDGAKGLLEVPGDTIGSEANAMLAEPARLGADVVGIIGAGTGNEGNAQKLRDAIDTPLKGGEWLNHKVIESIGG